MELVGYVVGTLMLVGMGMYIGFCVSERRLIGKRDLPVYIVYTLALTAIYFFMENVDLSGVGQLLDAAMDRNGLWVVAVATMYMCIIACFIVFVGGAIDENFSRIRRRLRAIERKHN